MTVEEQLRDYKATLDAATEAAAEPALPRGVAPMRVRPARTLVVAAVAVAATIAVAFAAVGVTHKSSTSPAGVDTSTTPTSGSSPITGGPVRVANVVGMKSVDATTVLKQEGFEVFTQLTSSCAAASGIVTAQQPPPGARAHAGITATLTVCTTQSPAGEVTLPVTVCDTVETLTDPTSRPPSTIVVPPSSANGDPVSGFADKHGRLVMTAPASWTCAALDATDGGTTVELPAPTGSPPSSQFDPASPSDHDGLFATRNGACQSCIHAEICGIVPNADAQVPGFGGLCTARPAGETITPLGNNVYRIEDPAGTVTPHAAISILIFHPRSTTSDASVARETCAFQNQLDICTSLLNQFLALNR